MLKINVASMKDTAKFGGLTQKLAIIFIAVLISNSFFNQAQSPIISSFVGALGFLDGIFAFFGALATYFFTGRISQSFMQISSILVIIGVKFVFCEVFERNFKAAGLSVLTGFSVLICGIISLMTTVITGEAVFVIFCNSILCGCATYFIKSTISAFSLENKLVLNGVAGGSLAVVFVILVATLSSVSMGIINIGRAFGILVTLFAAQKFKHLGGAVCGTLTTCGVVLFSPEMGISTMLLAVSGLVAGVFGEFGKLTTACFFIGMSAVGLIVIGVTPETARILVDVFVAVIGFIAIPERFLSRVLGVPSTIRVNERITELVSAKLDFAANTISEVRKNVEQISTIMRKREKESDISAMVCDNICGSCRNNLYCWESDFDRSLNSFGEVRNALQVKGKITVDDLPRGLNNCFRRLSVVECFNEFYRIQLFEKRASDRLESMRKLLYEQFCSTENLLLEISSEISDCKEYDHGLSQNVKTFIMDFGGTAPKICVFNDNFSHTRIEAFYSGDLKLSELEIAEEISDMVDREMELPEIFSLGDFTKLTIIEKPSYKLEVSIQQKSSNPDQPSGDSFQQFNDGLGNTYFVISDGMGTGKMAALDSVMSSSMLVKLLKSGIGIPAAVRLINSAMSVKSIDESFATLDIGCMNLYSGEFGLIKLGAAPTYIRCNGKISKIEAKSLPVGILGCGEIEKRSLILNGGDEFIMLSDGANSEEISGCLLRENESVECKTEFLMEDSWAKYSDDKKDDITIVAVKIIHNADN